MDYRVEIPKRFERVVQLPVSKSVAARVLVINALSLFKYKDGRLGSSCDSMGDEAGLTQSSACCLGDSLGGSSSILEKQLFTAPQCDDVHILAKALTSGNDCIDVEGSGTAMRFLTAFFACCEGRIVTLGGNERMRQRPICPLVDALRQMGASIHYLGNEGFPPLKINGKRLHGGSLSINGNVSSQFISALLMIAPVVGGMTLTLEGEVVSRPYIDMTIALMQHYGIDANWKNAESECQITVPKGQYAYSSLSIEADWSAASYWLALQALLPESKITLMGLSASSLQGDRAIVELMAPLGVKAKFDDSKVILLSDKVRHFPASYGCDMAATPDLVPTLAVTLCLLHVPFTLTGVRNLRIKESDRLRALREELAKLGYSLVVGNNSLSYDGNHVQPQGEVVIDPHGDHRIAMAMSLAATRHTIIIKDVEVVSKSYPTWWQELIKKEG